MPFYLCTCAVCDLFVYIKLLKTECDYNCKRWITRFAGRWRTQLAALSGVKCRTRRALDFRTHIAASGLSWGFVCLRVGMILKSLYKSVHVEYAVIKLLYSSDLFIHLTVSDHQSLDWWLGVRVIVQFIDDNSRTLHVLLVFDFLYDILFQEARILGLWWPTETVSSII